MPSMKNPPSFYHDKEVLFPLSSFLKASRTTVCPLVLLGKAPFPMEHNCGCCCVLGHALLELEFHYSLHVNMSSISLLATVVDRRDEVGVHQLWPVRASPEVCKGTHH